MTSLINVASCALLLQTSPVDMNQYQQGEPACVLSLQQASSAYVNERPQGSKGSWKTWKVLKFYYGIFQDWKLLEKGHWSWKVLEIC